MEFDHLVPYRAMSPERQLLCDFEFLLPHSFGIAFTRYLACFVLVIRCGSVAVSEHLHDIPHCFFYWSMTLQLCIWEDLPNLSNIQDNLFSMKMSSKTIIPHFLVIASCKSHPMKIARDDAKQARKSSGELQGPQITV